MLSCSTVTLAQHRETVASRFDGLFGCCSSTSLQLAKSLATDDQARLVQIRHFSGGCNREPAASSPSPDASASPVAVPERIQTNAAEVPPDQPPKCVSHDLSPRDQSGIRSSGPSASESAAATQNVAQAAGVSAAGAADDLPCPAATAAAAAVETDLAASAQSTAAAPVGEPLTVELPAEKEVLDTEPVVEQVEVEQQMAEEVAEVPQVQVAEDRPKPGEAEKVTGALPDTVWCTGTVRVLLATGSGPESSKRIEQWCGTCDISDVTILSFEGCTAMECDRRLGQSAAALTKRCQPGDTVVLHIAGLEDPAIIGISLAGQLPSMVTVVCIVDSRASLLLLGLDEESVCAVQDRSLRVVAMLLVQECSASPCAAASAAQADFSARAMLRAADALSLSDGPCSLSCRDFFQEMSDQASELAARTRVALPHTELIFHGTGALSAGEAEAVDAATIRWPLAAAPRNQANDSAGYTEVPVESSPFPPVLEPGVMDAGKFDLVPPQGLSDPPHRRSSAPVLFPSNPVAASTRARAAPSGYPAGRRSSGNDPRAPLLGRRKSDSHGEPRPRSSNRAMPTDLSGLSFMLTGGRLKGAPRSGSAGATRSGSAAPATAPGTEGVPAASVRRRSARHRRTSKQEEVEKSSKELESSDYFQKLTKELESSNEVLE
mmetsp:Transcript_98713/g.170976  ORF Transcript_98713/g.170976 Transcript_98713/m.170976 type:complete len:663 (-) Transcript_98713:89-2077(-)